MLSPSTSQRRDRISAWVRHAMMLFTLAAGFAFIAPADASAQACGGPNEPACTSTTCHVRGLFGNCLVWTTQRSCDSDRLNVRLTLQGYQCQPCGGAGQQRCDAGAACSSGTVLGPLGLECLPCGGAGQLACSGGACSAGTRNIAGICTACGSAGEIACSGGTCSAGTRNILGICTACGGPGDLVCTSGEACRGRTNVEGIGDAAICVGCGGPFQRPCEADFPACDIDLSHVGSLGGGRCVPFGCGDAGQIACSGGLCRDGTRNILGVCASCGGAGEPACTEGEACRGRTNQEGIGDASVCVACGGPFQAPCQNAFPACDLNLSHVGGPLDGRCVPFECGGAGQLQCASGPPCRPRHQPLLDLDPGFGLCIACGGEGQPFCETLDPGCNRPLRSIAGICTSIPSDIPEPDCNCTTVPSATPVGSPIWGFADLHAHQFANLAFGGVQFVGAPFDPDGITFALPGCGFTVDFPTVGPLGNPRTPGDLEGVGVHGAFHIRDLFGFAAGNPFGLSNFGSTDPLIPSSFSFTGWPLWKSPDHQRMYYRWLERAYRGGQRLMIMQAVNNELSCSTADQRVDTTGGGRTPFGCNDMATVDRQIQATKDLESFIDAQSGGPGRGWYRIVYSAAQAREVMSAGKMAVVLGIEVDSLFNCRGGACTEAFVESELQRYYGLGVRHAYPIHIFNNDFGGASYYYEAFNIGNLVLTGAFFQTYDCSAQGFEFRRAGADQQDALTNFLTVFLAANFGVILPPWVPSANAADCNQLGLTSLGRFLVNKMMDKGMLVDIDHMSSRGVNDVLSLAESRSYPVLATHVSPADLADGQEKGERKWTADQIRRLRDLGGIASPIIIPDPNHQHLRDGSPVVVDDCPASSKDFAQRYLRTVELMSGGPYMVGVGYGSDFNGMTQGVAPRFGGDACNQDEHAGVQTNQVQYPFSAHGMPGLFGRGMTGGRIFDYNTDGVAHVGLIPDMIQDLKNVGLTDQDLEPFFRSAEAFVQMWERIDARNGAPPTTAATVVPEPNAAGWNTTSVQVALNASSEPSAPPVTKIVYSASGAETLGPIDAPGSATTVDITADGATNFSFHAVDTIGRPEPEKTIAIRIDRQPPVVSPVVTPPPSVNGWHAGDVTVTFEGIDDQSGVAACDDPVVLTGEGAGLAASGSCTDVAGNRSAPTDASSINIDRTPPHVSAPPPIERESPPDGTPASDAALAAFLGAATAQDALDSAPQITHDGPAVFALGTTVVTFTATDHAGHTATAASTVTLRARAVITWPTPAAIVYGQMLGSGQLNATASVPGTFRYADPSGTILNAGLHTLRLSFEPDDTGRYLGATAEVPLTVLRAPLTITANDKSMILNGSLPEFTVSYAGFVNGDTSASLDTPVSVSTAATGSMAGAFPIDATGASDPNYAIAFVAGTLRVLYATGACLGAPGHVVLAPVAADGTSVYNGNRTVPVKFRVCDANGASVGTPGVVSNFRLVQQIVGTVPTPVDETVDSTTSHDEFRWDPAEAVWILNLKTKNLAVNFTYVFLITLNDGSGIEVRFGVR